MTYGHLALRHTIPLVILALGLCALGATYILSSRHWVEEIHQDAEVSMRALATLTAGSLEAAYRAGDAGQARAAIERLAGHQRLHNALLVDEQEIVLHATRVQWQAAELAGLEHGLPRPLIAHVQDAASPRVIYDSTRPALFGAFPVSIRSEADIFVPGSTGWLLIDFDLSAAAAFMRRDLMVQIAWWSTGLLVFCALLYLFLRRTVLTRIARLRAATRAVACGDLSIQPAITGRDEIADLAEDFRTMTRNLQRYQDRFQTLSLRDPHTGLFNRRGLERHLGKLLTGLREGNGAWLLCYFDVEGMQVLNSTRGHAAGDAILKQVAAHLKNRISDSQLIARIGGDEFAILLPLQEKQPEVRAREVLELLESMRFQWEETSHPVRFNLGAVVIDESVEDIETATSLANAARLAAKESSHRRVRIGRKDDADLDLSSSPMRWVNEISDALETDRFELFAQEIRGNRDTTSAGLFFEVLVRLRLQDGTLVSPGQFLPAAEKYRLAGQVDLWVLSHLLEFFRSHERAARQMFLCSINLSGLSLGSEEIIDLVSAELEKGTVRAEQLCFEITETAAITNLSAATEFIRRLRGLGCRFALDDFGSGVSSFGYLKRLEVDFIKIDGMFVRGVAADRTDRAIVKSINDIGHLTGKWTIAEFVESDDVARVLWKLGVDYIQGYGVGRPMPLAKMLRQSIGSRQTANG
ncbi:MAG: putative bifunctional diguanylate cyclase/phosphodiesterase [Wenzhouxiangella sp.]